MFLNFKGTDHLFLFLLQKSQIPKYIDHLKKKISSNQISMLTSSKYLNKLRFYCFNFMPKLKEARIATGPNGPYLKDFYTPLSVANTFFKYLEL